MKKTMVCHEGITCQRAVAHACVAVEEQRRDPCLEPFLWLLWLLRRAWTAPLWWDLLHFVWDSTSARCFSEAKPFFLVCWWPACSLKPFQGCCCPAPGSLWEPLSELLQVDSSRVIQRVSECLLLFGLTAWEKCIVLPSEIFLYSCS